MKKNILKLLSAFLLFAVLSCNVNSRFTNPSEYIRYAGQVNGGGGSGSSGSKLEYKILTLNIAGNGSVLVNSIEYETELKFLKNTKIKIEAVEEFGSGEVFQGFSGSIESSKHVEEITMDRDIIITASFIVPTVYKELRLTIRKGGGVEVDGVLHKNSYETNIALVKEYEEGAIVSLKAIPNDNAIIFGGWSGSIESMDNTITVKMDKSITLAASFSTEKQVTIDYPPNSYIKVSVDNSPITSYSNETDKNLMVYVDVEVGDKISITTLPINDRTHEFVEWISGSTSYSREKTIEFVIDKDILVTAVYKQIMRTLTIDTTPKKGYVISFKVNDKPYSGPIDLPRDGTVKVEAIEKYYELESWGGDITGTGRIYSFTLDEDKTINASFKTGPFDVYDNPDLNGYNAYNFEKWVIAVSDFGNKEIPQYYYTNKFPWETTESASIKEYKYRGDNSKAAGFAINDMDYFMYIGENYYMKRDYPNNNYNSGLHANRLKRFHFYRFTGWSGIKLGFFNIVVNLDNSLCALDTYTKLIWAYAVPTEFKKQSGQQVPIKWEAIEVKDEKFNGKDLNFYEYDPIGYVKSDGTVVLFKAFNDIQTEASGKADYKLYLPKEPTSAPAIVFDKTDKLNDTYLKPAGGNRSPYLE